jgi:hypothetical protein
MVHVIYLSLLYRAVSTYVCYLTTFFSTWLSSFCVFFPLWKTEQSHYFPPIGLRKQWSRRRLKCDGTRAETRFHLSAKRTSPFKSARASVQSTIGSRGVRISGSNAGYTMFRGSVTGTGYPLHSPFSLSLPLPCVTVCHHVSPGLSLYT